MYGYHRPVGDSMIVRATWGGLVDPPTTLAVGGRNFATGDWVHDGAGAAHLPVAIPVPEGWEVAVHVSPNGYGIVCAWYLGTTNRIVVYGYSDQVGGTSTGIGFTLRVDLIPLV